MNGRRFRSFKRFDGAIELVAFRDEKGDEETCNKRTAKCRDRRLARLLRLLDRGS
jgi:hypothetical protein